MLSFKQNIQMIKAVNHLGYYHIFILGAVKVK